MEKGKLDMENTLTEIQVRQSGDGGEEEDGER